MAKRLKLFGITYLVGKMSSRSNGFYFRVHSWLGENIENPESSSSGWSKSKCHDISTDDLRLVNEIKELKYKEGKFGIPSGKFHCCYHLSNAKRGYPGYLLYIGDEILPYYLGSSTASMDDSNGSGNGWAWDYMGPPNEGKDYTWYISGIYTANWVIICCRLLLPFETKRGLQGLPLFLPIGFGSGDQVRT